jgi:hypothetical protein
LQLRSIHFKCALVRIDRAGNSTSTGGRQFQCVHPSGSAAPLACNLAVIAA